jgi:hypothetical protein
LWIILQLQFPVVKESGGRLLETGVRTLQKTLLLKKEVEVAKVNGDLEEARRRFFFCTPQVEFYTVQALVFSVPL